MACPWLSHSCTNLARGLSWGLPRGLFHEGLQTLELSPKGRSCYVPSLCERALAWVILWQHCVCMGAECLQGGLSEVSRWEGAGPGPPGLPPTPRHGGAWHPLHSAALCPPADLPASEVDGPREHLQQPLHHPERRVVLRDPALGDLHPGYTASPPRPQWHGTASTLTVPFPAWWGCGKALEWGWGLWFKSQLCFFLDAM